MAGVKTFTSFLILVSTRSDCFRSTIFTATASCVSLFTANFTLNMSHKYTVTRHVVIYYTSVLNGKTAMVIYYRFNFTINMSTNTVTRHVVIYYTSVLNGKTAMVIYYRFNFTINMSTNTVTRHLVIYYTSNFTLNMSHKHCHMGLGYVLHI